MEEHITMRRNIKLLDSVFSAVIIKSPNYISAYLWIANTYSKMDPDTKLGLAKPKFEKVLEVAKTDSVKNASAMMDGPDIPELLSYDER